MRSKFPCTFNSQGFGAMEKADGATIIAFIADQRGNEVGDQQETRAQ